MSALGDETLRHMYEVWVLYAYLHSKQPVLVIEFSSYYCANRNSKMSFENLNLTATTTK